ncbi:MAG TPA: S9 family peptidase [Caulobacteraceae bacterium]
MFRFIAGCVGALMALAAPLAAVAAPPPLSAYGALPAIENIAISGSGSKIAFITVAGEQRRLIMQEVSGAPIGVIEVGDSKVRDLIWAGDEHLLIVTSKTTSMAEFGIPEHEWFIGQSYSLAKKRVINIGAQAQNSLNVMANWPVVRQVDGRWYAYITTFNLKRPIIELQRVLLDDGRTEPVEHMGQDAEEWLVDGNGVPQARSRYNQVTGYWSLGVRKGAIWPDVFQVEAKLDSPQIVSFGKDGHAIVVSAQTNQGRRFLEVSPETGEVTDLHPDSGSFTGVIVDPASRRAIGARYIDGYEQAVFFDPADQATWNSVKAAFKGQQARLIDWSRDRRKVVVLVEGAQNSGVYYLVDLGAKRADILGETYPGVPPGEVAEMKPYSYKAADGLEIPGFLTLPPGREAKGLPLIVFPHGGPQAEDVLGFDFWAQAMASRGYAVLQPNFRGSSTEESLTEAGYGEWGRKMQTDLSDGVKALAAEGVIDPARVCIVGASYGGYAAMAGVTLQKGVYRCAVAVSGIADPQGFLKWKAMRGGRKTEAMRYWHRFMGVDEGGAEVLDEIAPLSHVADAQSPILLIHGRDDTVVPYRQSVVLAEALEKAGKRVEMVTLDGEDHWMSRGATRQRMLEATVAFLLRENPPN